MKNIAVVGGGIAGLYAALFLANRKFNVHLVESSAELGGLLRSVPTTEGFEFDCGAHFLRDTGIKEIDEDIFYTLGEEWQRLPFLKIGTFYNEQFYDKSPFISAHHLSESDYLKGLSEFLSLPPSQDYENCYDYLARRFGKTYTEKLFREPIEKFYTEKLEKLAPLAPRFFDLIRIICLTPESAREIKKSPWYDARVGFHNYTEGLAGIYNYYPATGGIGKYIDFLKGKLLAKGVKIHLSNSLEMCEFKDKKINSIKLKSGESIVTDHVVWTLPVPALNKVANVKYETPKMKFKTSVLVDLASDKMFQTDVFYAVCYSGKYNSFRIFFYPNANKELQVKGQYSTCVEVITDFDKTDNVSCESIFNELKLMKFLPEDAKMTFHRKRSESAGFPVYSTEFVNESAKLRKFAEDSYSNVTLVGKSNGKIFFMNDTLVDTYKTLKTFIGEPLT